jgi:hypothetical protein
MKRSIGLGIAASGLGAGAVRLATGTPTAVKNSSCPGGEHRHNSRAGRWLLLRNACGALAGMLTVSPARTTDLMPREVHINEAVAAGGVFAREKDRVDISNYSKVGQRLIFVRSREHELSLKVIGRNDRTTGRHIRHLMENGVV